jgi:hypothetical protein
MSEPSTSGEPDYSWMDEILNPGRRSGELGHHAPGEASGGPGDEPAGLASAAAGSTARDTVAVASGTGMAGTKTGNATARLGSLASGAGRHASVTGRTPGFRWTRPPQRAFIARKPVAIGVVGVVAIGIVVGVLVATSGPNGGKSALSGVGASHTPGSVAVGQGTSAPGNGSGPGTASTVAGGALPGPMPGAPSNPVVSPAPTAPPTNPDAPQALKPSDPVQVKTWNAGQAGKAMALVTTQAGSVLMAHGSGSYAEMLTACKALAGAVESAASLPPIPDAAMRSYYQKALTAFRSGITACESGITQHEEGVEDIVTQVNQTDIKRAIKKFGTGMTDLYVATGYLRQH